MYVRQDTRKHCVSQQLLANFCLQGVETFGSMRGEPQRDVGYGSAALTRLPGTSAAYSQLRTPSAPPPRWPNDRDRDRLALDIRCVAATSLAWCT
jgi:hypothetical protein